MLLVYLLAGIFYSLALAYFFFPSKRQQLVLALTMPPSSNQTYSACLDGWRGLSAFWVVCFHSLQWTSPALDSLIWVPLIKDAYNAVCIFCVISGFLIYRSARAIKDLSGTKKYFIRRFLRIYPLYLVTVALGFILFPSTFTDSQRAIAEILMLHSFGYPNF